MRFWLGLLLVLTSLPPALAADWYTGAPGDEPAIERPARVAIDTAFDGTTQRAFSGALIATIAPFNSLEQSGMRLRLYGLGGVYNYYSATGRRIDGRIESGALMAGYEYVSRTLSVAGYAGVELTQNSISPNDPNNTVKGGSGGLRIGVDVYYTPTPFSMVSGVAYYATNHNAYYSRMKLGFAIADAVYVGPEALALGDDFFQQYRIGAHISGLRLGALQLGVSGGFLQDRVRGAGGYSIVESRVSF